jgi:c-di-GMP-binding flagellar brake protein YcgR
MSLKSRKGTQISTIQVFNQTNTMILEVKKGFDFPVRIIDGKPVDNVLVIKGRHFPELHRGAIVDIVINTKSGNRIKYYCLVDFSSHNQLVLILSTQRAQELADKRRFKKVKTEVNCRVTDVVRGSEVTAYNPNLYGKIHDINLGGMFVVIDTADTYNKEDMISFTAVLGENRLEASARILRVQTSAEGELTGYGCSFAALPDYQEEMISSYVNYLQIEERRIEMERMKIEKELNS